MKIGWAIVLAIGLIVAALVYSGVYQMVITKEGLVYRINRLTGDTEVCAGARCERVP